MITYILKTIACTGMLLMVYHLVFARERMYRFNRLYLLAAIITAFIAPLVTITIPVEQPGAGTVVFIKQAMSPQFTDITTTIERNRVPVWPFVITGIYILVTIILISRFIINITLLLRAIKTNRLVMYNGAKLVLSGRSITPYSFLSYIFVNEGDYNNGLEGELLTHELAHVNQRHTFDILFIELLHAVAWFNPFIILYKKAIQVNHEFLADEAVLCRYNNVANYQNLLLGKIVQNTHTMFASSFNYLTTKKRLLMMTKTTTTVKKVALQLLSLLLIGGSVLMLSTKVTAQVKQKDAAGKQTQAPVVAQQTPVGNPVPNSATQDMLDEYEQAIKNASKTLTDKNGVPRVVFDGSSMNRDRMNFIYYSMTQEQRAKASKCFFIPEIPPPAKTIPTAELFKKWGADSKAYGVWVNGKRIPNSKLATLNPNDYCYYDVSGLTPAAVKNDGFRVQVSISTIDNYNQNFALSLKYAKYYDALHKNDK